MCWRSDFAWEIRGCSVESKRISCCSIFAQSYRNKTSSYRPLLRRCWTTITRELVVAGIAEHEARPRIKLPLSTSELVQARHQGKLGLAVATLLGFADVGVYLPGQKVETLRAQAMKRGLCF